MQNPSPQSPMQNVDPTGLNVIYRERVLPGIWSWVLVAFMTASLGIAYGYVYGKLFGIVIAIISTLALYFFMLIGSPVIQIDEQTLKVGNARIPREFLGSARLLDEAQTYATRRTPAHRDAYLVMRAAVKMSVIIDITDTSDPHPYWQFSTRKPKSVINALESH